MTEKKYSQVNAMLAITKGALKAIFRSPSAVVFSLAFPMIFILVFGFIGSGGSIPVYKIVIDTNSDTTNAFFDSVKTSKRLRIVRFENEAETQKNIQKGRIAGILVIKKNNDSTPPYTYSIKSSSASNDKWPQLRPVLEAISNNISNQQYGNRPSYAKEDFDYMRDISQVREYKKCPC